MDREENWSFVCRRGDGVMWDELGLWWPGAAVR
jgi:hypothetical protein